MTSRFDLGHHLDLEFSRSNMEFAISAKNGTIDTKRKTNISIELYASNVTTGFDLGHDLDLEFSRSNMEFAVSLPKWYDCHETKSKHIDWTLGLKWGQWVWPWPWPWHLNFQAQMWSWPFGHHADSDRGDFGCRRAVDSSSCSTCYVHLLT